MRKILGFFVGMVAISNIYGQTDLTQGIKLIANENYGDATKFFEKVMTAEPKNGLPIYYLGKIKYALEDSKGAEELFNKAALLDKKCTLCEIGQLQMMLDNGKTAEADKAAVSLEKSGKKNASILAALGDAYLFSKKPNAAKAIALLTKSRDIDPKVGSTWAHLGDAFNLNGENGNAMSSYQVAVDKDKSNVEAYVSMGKIWKQAKNYELGSQELEKAIKIDPEFAPAYKELIEIYSRMEKYSKVTPLLEKYVPLAGTDEQAKVRLVKYLTFQAKDYERAITQGEELKKTSQDYTLNRWLGWSYIEKEKYEEGYQAMKKFIDDVNAEPTKREAFMLDYDYLARAAAKTNRMDEALQLYQTVIKKDPTKTEEIYNNLAKSFYDSKTYEKAIVYYMKRDSIKPLNNAELLRLAQSQMQVKNYPESEKLLRKYITIDPTFLSAYLLLARSVANQDPDRVTWAAIPEYQKYLELANAQADKTKITKNMVDAHMYIGYGMVSKNDSAAAKSAFESVLTLDPTNADAIKYVEILSKAK